MALHYAGALWSRDDNGNLVRHDVKTGTETNWGTMLREASVVGVDEAGEPIVSKGGAVAIHHAGGGTTTVWPGTNGLSASSVISDRLGISLEVNGASGIPGAPGSGIYLWKPASGARLVSPEAVHPMGPCI